MENKLTPSQRNVLAALHELQRGRKWIPHNALESFDGRTVTALQRRGLLELDLEYGLRLRTDLDT